jgi:glucuronate isomerase
MMQKDLFKKLMGLPLMDAHTHIDASHLTARGLHDVLLYHMIISELYSAGCPDGTRLSEDPGEDEIAYRIERALPYLKHIGNTSCFWGAKMILKDLYGWDKPVTKDNWREIHAIIQQKSTDKTWARAVMGKAGIKRISTEFWRRRDGSADDILQFALEWAFFARCQWGQYDTALLELEVTRDLTAPGSPLPVTIEGELKVSRPIRTLSDVKEALQHYCDLIPFDRVMNTNQSFSTDIDFRIISDEEMASALTRRATAGPAERDIYAGYILEGFLSELEKRRSKTVIHLALGAEPLPYESGSKLRSETVFQLAEVAQRHTRIDFHVFLANAHQNQALCTLCRELPNVYVIGYWWHNFFPSYIGPVFEQRLDMLPLNKQIGFFTDAYCMDWAYAKSIIIRKQMAEVLAKKVEQGQYTKEQAIGIAATVLHDTARDCLGMRE